uniref:hypothetical protein n=1 Tax=Clostridium sp. NkU-1 TaxID=1095009 RepID=UPI000AFFE4DE
MKLNLSVDEEEFKKQVKDLRQKLNKIRETGILDDDFEKCLEVLSAKEEKLLTEMIPHYRAYAGNSKDAIKTESVTRLGACGFEGFFSKCFKAFRGYVCCRKYRLCIAIFSDKQKNGTFRQGKDSGGMESAC